MRDAQTELGTRVDARAGKLAAAANPSAPATNAAAFAKGLGNDVHLGEQRIIHRRMRKPYKKRMRMPSMLDPHLADIERWLAAEPRLTALAILGRLAERLPRTVRSAAAHYRAALVAVAQTQSSRDDHPAHG